MRLFTPGPTNVPKDVLAVLGHDIPHHRSAPFAVAFEELIKNLKTIFHSTGEMVVLTSSGTGGLEAGISNLFNPKDKVVVVSNGYFGERLVAIAKQYQLTPIVIESPWGKSVSIEAVKKAIESDSSIVGLIAAHCDTSTGVINDIQRLGELAHQHGLFYLVDSISGLPLNPFEFDDWHIDLAVSASQKGFYLPPGLSFISLSPRAVQRLESTTQGRYYFDLRKYLASIHDHYQTPFSPNISHILAGAYATQKMVKKGIENLQRATLEMRDYLHPKLVALGFKPLVAPSDWGASVIAYSVPSGMDSSLLRTYLMESWKIMIEGGLGPRRNEIIRIGFMSDLSLKDANDLLKGITSYMKGVKR